VAVSAPLPEPEFALRGLKFAAAPPYVRSPEQFPRADAERNCQTLNNGDCGIARATFDVTYISTMDTSFVGKGLLAQGLAFAQAAHISTEALTNIHAALKATPSTMNLQTMSDIVVDFACP
jgi:hypothetical protein